MINSTENYQIFNEYSEKFHIQGVCVLEISFFGEIELIFRKGLTTTFVEDIIDIYRYRIFETDNGTIIDSTGSYNLFLSFAMKSQGEKEIVLFIDTEDRVLNSPILESFSKALFNKLKTNIPYSKIESMCNNIIEIQRAKGVIGVLILDKTGILYYSKVKKERTEIAKNIFQIAGFISALMIYSHDLIGDESAGLKLEDIDMGNYHFYLSMRSNIIFAYFVEKNNCSENVERNTQIIFEEFLERYYNSYVKNFCGDLTPFHEFEDTINLYFEI